MDYTWRRSAALAGHGGDGAPPSGHRTKLVDEALAGDSTHDALSVVMSENTSITSLHRQHGHMTGTDGVR